MPVVTRDHCAPASARLDLEAPEPAPSSSHERGTAGPEKGAMAFLDDAEATTYCMLQQVLQNHCTTYALCLPHTPVACGALVALVCAQVETRREALWSRWWRTRWRISSAIRGYGDPPRPSRRSLGSA